MDLWELARLVMVLDKVRSNNFEKKFTDENGDFDSVEAVFEKYAENIFTFFEVRYCKSKVTLHLCNPKRHNGSRKGSKNDGKSVKIAPVLTREKEHESVTRLKLGERSLSVWSDSMQSKTGIETVAIQLR